MGCHWLAARLWWWGGSLGCRGPRHGLAGGCTKSSRWRASRAHAHSARCVIATTAARCWPRHAHAWLHPRACCRRHTRPATAHTRTRHARPTAAHSGTRHARPAAAHPGTRHACAWRRVHAGCWPHARAWRWHRRSWCRCWSGSHAHARSRSSTHASRRSTHASRRSAHASRWSADASTWSAYRWSSHAHTSSTRNRRPRTQSSHVWCRWHTAWTWHGRTGHVTWCTGHATAATRHSMMHAARSAHATRHTRHCRLWSSGHAACHVVVLRLWWLISYTHVGGLKGKARCAPQHLRHLRWC